MPKTLAKKLLAEFKREEEIKRQEEIKMHEETFREAEAFLARCEKRKRRVEFHRHHSVRMIPSTRDEKDEGADLPIIIANSPEALARRERLNRRFEKFKKECEENNKMEKMEIKRIISLDQKTRLQEQKHKMKSSKTGMFKKEVRFNDPEATQCDEVPSPKNAVIIQNYFK